MKSDDLTETFGPLSMWDSIVAFHEKFGHEMPSEPVYLDPKVHDFRMAFIEEELTEYATADTLEDKVDALVDLVVVIMGTAYMHGFDWPAHWEEVYEANMRKRRASHAGESKRGTSLDIVKPEGWVGPNHKRIFDRNV